MIAVRQRQLADRARVAELTPQLDADIGFMREQNRELLKNAGLLNKKIRRANAEHKSRAAAQRRALGDFDDATALVGTPAAPTPSDDGLDDFADAGDLI